MEQQEEIWKDIVIEKNGVLYDFTGLYQVSNLGRVRSLNFSGKSGKKHILAQKQTKKGYFMVELHRDRWSKQFYVHRLVATAFIPNPDNLLEVNHRDECKSNNRVDNLEWCDRKYNVQYSSHKLREAKSGSKNYRARKVICIETGQVFNTMKEAQEWIGKTSVSACCKGIIKACGGYRWMYYDEWLKLQSENN